MLFLLLARSANAATILECQTQGDSLNGVELIENGSNKILKITLMDMTVQNFTVLSKLENMLNFKAIK